MAKHFRLRITRVFRTKHSPPTSTTTPQPPKRRRISSFKRRLSSAFLCRCSSKFNNYSDDETTAKPLDFHWQNDLQEWNVVPQNDDESPRQKIYNSSVSGGDSDDTDILAPTLLPPPPTHKKRRRRKKKTTLKHNNRISTSSAETETLVSSSRSFSPEETETLVSSSSRSFSTDDSSTEYNPQLKTIREKPAARHKKPKKKKNLEAMTSSSRCSVTLSSESESPARLSVFRKLIPCAVEGKVKESFAVVKKSVDPYEDFKKSMSDMIFEKEMFEEKELEQLLQCFLSLNSRQHHGVIVQAFAEIWNSMFSVNSATAVSN
ncbi:Transcription repressor [Heracleum sosnowskyi]|uniref:Transcription repressor n=1 Tax=Heracleum sosnowskyi TaxID=360622 RepID=A0AAD8M8N7_9APIA|nr:Transcription repressor [Heracleum sosnowskyi]